MHFLQEEETSEVLTGGPPITDTTGSCTFHPQVSDQLSFTGHLQRPYIRETVHSALNLLCIMRAHRISATRGHARQLKVLTMTLTADCSATCQQG